MQNLMQTRCSILPSIEKTKRNTKSKKHSCKTMRVHRAVSRGRLMQQACWKWPWPPLSSLSTEAVTILAVRELSDTPPFPSSTLNWGEWSVSRSGRFYTRGNCLLYPLDRWLGVPLDLSGRCRNIWIRIMWN
jgi:hypothetical protein